jgi:4-hydroxymandelate oxidase
MRAAPEFVNVFDFEPVARERLSELTYAYYSSGANDEITVRENRAAFDRHSLHYRVLVDVGQRVIGTTVLGQAVSMPILVAPTAFHRLAHPDGEIATARAAGSAGTILALSCLSNTPVEEVTQAASGPIWFQLYVYRDRSVTRDLVQRVEDAGCRALMVTVEAPVLGRRERDLRNRFTLPPELVAANLTGAGLGRLPTDGAGSGLATYFAALLDPTLTWDVLDWLRSITRLPILIKGIVRPDDAVRAVERGVAAIVVSNHGGRQLDTAPATIDVLGPIAEAVAGRVEILLDGGIRRGTDVVKALALGARAVMVGRPVLWGLAAAGEQGVMRVLEILRDELDTALALCGCPSLDAVTTDLVG